ncbi:uncharacterized protein TRUGW13939_00244 [Talaromyces rugulosus]|uniref:Uncharacterized protein n=1 Tax=Talaromyces rugulosus TaxID=121627 RepID=A0A7H8QGV9_TALRU|nr:uncharacterized protein TRUGW13939_00244 [Talaromyces rugulosus]QKX53168.1 hypothetical protein TRUGW13939_00244 [Talaromyces rugulosus]
MDNGTSPTDIITYVGVPLAVLGVLPILYSFVRAILTQRSIRLSLKRHGLLDSAITRGSLMSGIVEVELPRCTITPFDRDLDAEYWKLNAYQSTLKGGSWSIFYWNRLVTGRRLYRCQFKDELRLPQAEIDFEELVAFLMDRGAVPDPKGWHMLKTIGLWTPTATALLKPPNDLPGTVLKIAPPDDSEGVLSLQVYWHTNWDFRDTTSLPPFWMRLGQPKFDKVMVESETTISLSPRLSKENVNEPVNSLNENETKPLAREDTLVAGSSTESNTLPTSSLLGSIEQAKNTLTTSASDSVRFKIDAEIVRKLSFESDGILTGETRDMANVGGDNGSLWFVCAASTICQGQNSGLWNFTIPDQIATFTRRKSIPCGVMVVLDLLDGKDVPPWASPPPKTQESHTEIHQRLQERDDEMRMERLMTPTQADESRRSRMLREARRFHQQNVNRMQLQREYEERRLIEAIQSPRLDNNTVANATLAYLIREKVIPDHFSLQELAHAVLYLMILDQTHAKLIADILERWALWAQFGGMQSSQLTHLTDNKVAFCYASALVAVVLQANSSSNNLSSDMLDCMRVWKRVNLG